MERLKKALAEKILILDGAGGTMIQKQKFKESDFRGREFLNHPSPMSGFNDILNLTKPGFIKEMHLAYLRAGADIITTNTFNANAISMADFGLAETPELISRINTEGAFRAREALSDFEKNCTTRYHFIAGSVGPTNRSASLSPDISNPLVRNVTFDELLSAYKTQVEGLLSGGVDLLLFETFFDTLNLKAALKAANQVMEELKKEVPIMVSATVSDNSGRILSGQSLEAFIASIQEYKNIEVIGLNCGFGPDKMSHLIKRINTISWHYTSCHPNAGLPDEKGCYNVTPADFCKSIEKILNKERLNIIGGCCGTTPEHIKEISSLVKRYHPELPIPRKKVLQLSGLDILNVDKGFIAVGERCNVAGSAKFLRLIKENSYEEAAEIARKQIANGAKIIDINTDDPLLDVKKEMVDFVRYILGDPEIAKVPFMIDSSNFEVITDTLKNIQGKGIVNSISLKEGEEIFLKKARKIKDLGFSLVVMAFDERGQADTYQRKIEICKRSYDLLTKRCGFYPEDIIFDANVMTIGTGMIEHARYAIDFIEAVKWIKENLPGAKTSGGVSNLSFAFRGKNKLREYMHSIFLHYAIEAGLDIAIINPGQKIPYKDIPTKIKILIEDLIFNRTNDAIDKLLALMEELTDSKDSQKNVPKYLTKEEEQNLTTSEILVNDMIEGELIKLEEHLHLALKEIKSPIKIIEGPLLDGMKRVGEMFGRGEMFLPQVVKTARSMKKAVEILTPFINNNRESSINPKQGKIIIATVKGDVHDIGKNIVATVLTCNNYEVIDLGIMVSPEKIVETAIKEKPDIICLSGLITPSLSEMIITVKALEKAGIKVPVMVGGAATSLIHTALKIDPVYTGVVLHMEDASQNPVVASYLTDSLKREAFLEKISLKYETLKNVSEKKGNFLPYEKVIAIIRKEERNNFNTPKPNSELDNPIILQIQLEEILPLINWKMFFLAWKIQGKFIENFPFSLDDEKIKKWFERIDNSDLKKAEEALKLYKGCIELITSELTDGNFDGKAVVVFKKAEGDINSIKIDGKSFPMLRQQRENTNFMSCSDFIGSKDSYIALFAVTAGNSIFEKSKRFSERNDSYKSLILQALADRIAEASAEWLQNYVASKFWEVKIRPAWGYPMLPDQTLILDTSDYLPYNDLGIKLTENGAMYPPASISGLFISNPIAKYFMVGEVGEDQLESYAELRKLPLSRIRQILRY